MVPNHSLSTLHTIPVPLVYTPYRKSRSRVRLRALSLARSHDACRRYTGGLQYRRVYRIRPEREKCMIYEELRGTREPCGRHEHILRTPNASRKAESSAKPYNALPKPGRTGPPPPPPPLPGGGLSTSMPFSASLSSRSSKPCARAAPSLASAPEGSATAASSRASAARARAAAASLAPGLG